MSKTQKTVSEIVIFENNQNQDLESSIPMKFDAECNETTPAISLSRFHEDSEMFTKKTSKKATNTPNRRV